jgi:hypothetical protein
VLVAIVGTAVYSVWLPPSNDFAVQHFRSALFRKAPFAIWSNQWFGGHHMPAYSLLAPALGSVIGAVVLGVLSVLVGSLVGSLLVHAIHRSVPGLRRPELAGALLAVGLLSSLFGGRTTFLSGAALGIAALWSAVRGKAVLATALALASALSSPVAGVFLATIGLAALLSKVWSRRVAAGLVIPTMVPIVGMTVLFYEPGNFPFPLGGTVNLLLATALVAWLGWRHLFLRWMCAGYAAFVLLCFAVPNPVGGNVARLAALAVPVAVTMVAAFAMRWLAVVMVPLLVLQWAPVSLAFRLHAAQTEQAFYRPLLDLLASRSTPLRVEVVPVATHFEADIVALDVPIARGWNRQHDRLDNALFYGDRLDADTYRAWLVNMGVSVVAIADTALDEGGTLEAALLTNPPEYLHELPVDGPWRVFEVLPAPSLSTGPATLERIGVEDFALRAEGAGDTVVRVRFSPWFHVEGDACVAESADGWTLVRTRSAGAVRVAAELGWSNLLDRDGNC